VRIALDASYSVDPRPSGIGIYSAEILNGLASAYPRDEFLHCYRAGKYAGALRAKHPNVRRRLLLPSFPTFRADVFHALNQRLDRRPAKRVVCTFHDLFVLTAEYSSPEFRARFSKQARDAARRADLIIAVSDFTARQVSNLLAVEPARIRVVPHGVHPAQPSQAPREKIVLFVGVLQKRKNLLRLLEAFEALPADWRLILAGASSGYEAQAIVDRASALPRVQVAGYLAAAAMDQLYARASIFAFPSLDEGFGIPVLEAMAHGLPVVTSNCSALPEVAGDAALLVSPYDTTAIAQALTTLAEDADLRHELARRGEARAREYTWARAVAQTYTVYREL
jgi:glycosyltransferase involved in cell wall biosynthesis